MDQNRRSFLVKAGRRALGLSCGLPLLSAGCNSGQGTDSSSQWAMIIDVKKCRSDEVRRACADACHREHKVPLVHLDDDPDTVDAKREIKWIWTEQLQHAFPDQVHAHRAAIKETPVLVLCNHCARPPCTKVCPTGATWKRPSDGLVMMDMHRCIGCRYCMAACPYGARSFNWSDPRQYPTQGDDGRLPDDDPDRTRDYPSRNIGVVEKCTFCAEKIRTAGDGEKPLPACVKAANQEQEGAIAFGRLGDEEIKRKLEDNRTICRRISLGTGPNVFYIV